METRGKGVLKSASMETRGKGNIGPKKIRQVWRKKQPAQPHSSRLITTPVKMGGKEKGKKKVKQVWRRKPPPWVELPMDITANILHRLGAVEILSYQLDQVCTTWRNVCRDPSFWRVIDMRDEDSFFTEYELDMICRDAVDLSQGQLIDINIEFFTDDKLLEYISNRCRGLKRLRLAGCDRLSSYEAFKRFPLLEELSLAVDISSECVELIGQSCPLLMSFSLRGVSFFFGSDDEAAFAIARSMPKLQHLRLFRNSLTNKGLEAILDGCPYLESLELRQCNFVKLHGDLGKRCSEKIKCLKCPTDLCEEEEEEEFYAGILDNPYPLYPIFDYSDFEDDLSYDDYTRLEYYDEEDWDVDDEIFGFL